MIKILLTVIGFLIGAGAFLALLQVVPSLTNNKIIAIFIFLVLFGAGIWIANIAWWLAIIIGIISFIVYAIKKKKPLQINEGTNDLSSETNSSDKNSNVE